MTNGGLRPSWQLPPRAVLLSLSLSLGAPGCHPGERTSTDGETHFLSTCSGACGSGLICECGVCTLPCSESAACRELPASAECFPVADRSPAAACAGSSTAAFCDLRCADDRDCTELSGTARCVGGFCRHPGECPPGDVSGNEVVVLGDVFIAQSHRITAYLEEMARAAGALAAGERYRDYSSTIDNGFVMGALPLAEQYTSAQAESPVRVVIMDGGGADMLLGSCGVEPSADCPLMLDVVAAADELLARMAEDQVEDIVWFFYPDPSEPDLLAEMDVLRPLLEGVCRESAAPCRWVDLRTTFAGHESEYLVADAIPSDAGAQATAGAIWSTMQLHCIAQ